MGRIRNLTVRELPDGTLFPVELTQYDPWVIREALHNCIAHQDYGLRGRVQVVETPQALLLTNVGGFLPGRVEDVIDQDAPLEIYRNPYLAEANFPHLEGDSHQSSPHLAPDSPHTVASSPHLAPELLLLAEPARLKGKLPAAEMRALVLRLCEARWLTSKDLAALLSRDAENLQGRILAGLVRKGLLELRFPDVPNRPDQAYRTVSK